MDLRPAITYFPIDKTSSFIITKTRLNVDREANTLSWSTTSTMDDPAYLRQDLALLYANGYFKAVINNWKQSVQALENHEVLSYNPAVYYQAITFHFAEKHDRETITSVQDMSFTNLNAKNDLKQQTNQQLQSTLTSYLDHFNIKREEYIHIPLVSLAAYNDKPLLNFSKENSQIIIGHLWEGLYKNYVLRLSDSEINQGNMPFILLAKDQTHLIILFSLDNKKEIYIQNIPLTYR